MRSSCAVRPLALAAVLIFWKFLGSAYSAGFFGLGDLPGGDFGSRAQAVSADGTVVVGFSSTAAGKEAFRWTHHTGMVALDNLPDAIPNSYAQGVSADGSVIVGGGFRSWRWTNDGGFVVLAGTGSAQDVSADGSVVVGYGIDQPYPYRWTNELGVVYLDAAAGVALGVSADGSVVAGYAEFIHSRPEAFRWTNDGRMVPLGTLPGATSSYAIDVSNNGSTVVGSVHFAPGTVAFRTEAFRWTSDLGMIGLGHLPGGKYSTARAVSADGSLIVGDDGPLSFIWDASHGMRELVGVLAPLVGSAISGWTSLVAEGISADGRTIVGFGINPSGNVEAWVASLDPEVPEPSMVALLFIAAMLTPRRRIRRTNTVLGFRRI